MKNLFTKPHCVFRNSPTSHARLPIHLIIAWLVSLLSIGRGLLACQGNVDLIPEKRVLDRIEGSSRCESALRVSNGTRGEHRMRLYLVDEGNEDIPPGRLKDNSSSFSIESLSIREGSAQVFEKGTGKRVDGAGVTLTLKAGDSGTDWIQENPNYTSTKGVSSNLRPPRAVSLLFDMSAKQRSSLDLQRASSAGWIRNFNDNRQRGNLDAFALLSMRNNLFTRNDNLFIDEDVEKQLIGASRQAKGFLITTESNKEDATNKLLGLTGSSRNAPLYGTITEAAAITRDVSWDEAKQPINNPAIVALSLSRDAHSIDSSVAKDQLNDAKSALQGEQYIPLMAITSPRPSDIQEEDWSRHLNQLCDLSRTATAQGSTHYFGQVFQLRLDIQPDPDNASTKPDAQEEYRKQLDMAYHAMSGWLEVIVNYQLTSLPRGKTY
ncbi:MAG: hypothetical protein AAGJ35_05000, partial [Myxococcota bacterium]